LSPELWNTAFCACNYAGIYVPFKVSAQHLDAAFSGLKALNIAGVNVTMPHKAAAARMCTRLHQAAQTLGSVNTIRFSPNHVEGFNTDSSGFKRILAQTGSPDAALVMGNGAASQAAIWALAQNNNTKIYQISRKMAHCPAFISNKSNYSSFLWSCENLLDLISHSSMVINATPLGMNKQDQLVELEKALDSSKFYIDLNYNEDSRLLAAARASRCRLMDGRELLLAQALDSFKILTDLDPPEKIMRSTLF
jgi:shikimate dehydrogenase